jgi:hypothetical protein
MNHTAQPLDEIINMTTCVSSVVQQLAQKINMSFDEFVGEMRKRGCSEPTAIKIWHGEYETYKNFNDHDLSLSNLRKAADALKVVTGMLFPEVFTGITGSGDFLVTDKNHVIVKQKDADYSGQSGEK